MLNRAAAVFLAFSLAGGAAAEQKKPPKPADKEKQCWSGYDFCIAACGVGGRATSLDPAVSAEFDRCGQRCETQRQRCNAASAVRGQTPWQGATRPPAVRD